jgi:excisionase family DNA binding protein
MKIYKITEASGYLGVSINTLKMLANNGKIKSFKITGEHRRFRQEDLDSYMGVEKEKQEKLTVEEIACLTIDKIIALITDRIKQLRENEDIARNAKDYVECLHSHYGVIELERLLKILER